MKQTVELVVFDIAGTTVKDNGAVIWAFKNALRHYGYSVQESEVALLMGYKKTKAIEVMLKMYEHDPELITGNLIDEVHCFFLQQMINYYASASDLAPAPDAEEVFAILKELGIKVALNTGFSKAITDVIMERLGWMRNKKVDYVMSSDEVESGRPDPFMIRNIMHQAGINDPKKVIKVGDTEVDINEGKNAGCLYTIGITTGAYSRQQLKTYNPSFIIDELKELLPIIHQN
jgi:phosphonatase-like hydrolase